jgi:cytochrome c
MSNLARVAALLTLLAPVSTTKAADDDDKAAFNNYCRYCHSSKEGDNRLGPSLYGVVGAKAGQVAGYGGYSGGLTGFTWDEATLDKFIANPTSISPNTTMKYPPVADPVERKKIIQFLKSISAQ